MVDNILKTLFTQTQKSYSKYQTSFIYFRFSTLFRKNIYLCHTLSAHQRDVISGECFLLLYWSK